VKQAMAQAFVDGNSSSERLKGKQVLPAGTICVRMHVVYIEVGRITGYNSQKNNLKR
jgi:hypothetical protein